VYLQETSSVIKRKENFALHLLKTQNSVVQMIQLRYFSKNHVSLLMSHIWLGHVQMSHVSLSHVSDESRYIANESCFIRMSHTHSPPHTHWPRARPRHHSAVGKCVANQVGVGISHVSHMNESWRTYEGIMSLIWMSHVAVWWQLRRKLSAVFRQVGPLDVGRCV